MAATSSKLWRIWFFLSGVLVITGTMMHPRADMAAMLQHPHWVLSHLVILAGIVALLAGIVLHGRAFAAAGAMPRWRQAAVWATVLEAIEMMVHTWAVVDKDNLAAGAATPVLTTHIWLMVFISPLFAAAMTWFVLATSRERSLGSPWISWLGILGIVAHGLAAPLVGAFGIVQAVPLFPMIMLFGLWSVLAALWPARRA